MNYVTQTDLSKVLEVSLNKIDSLLRVQGVKNYNIMFYGFPKKPKRRFKTACIGVEDSSGKKLLFVCDLIIHSYPCGCLSLLVRAQDITRNTETKEPQYLNNCRLGKDDLKVPTLSTSYFAIKLTPEILVADIMFKFNMTIQTIHNVNYN